MIDNYEKFKVFINNIEDESNREKYAKIISFIDEKYSELNHEIKWNQPMYTLNNSFIFSAVAYKKGISMAPEKVILDKYSNRIKEIGYKLNKQTFNIAWNDTVDYKLIEDIINDMILIKRNHGKFWL